MTAREVLQAVSNVGDAWTAIKEMDRKLRNGRVYMNDGAANALCSNIASTCMQRIAMCMKSERSAIRRRSTRFVETFLRRCPAKLFNVMAKQVVPLLHQAYNPADKMQEEEELPAPEDREPDDEQAIVAAVKQVSKQWRNSTFTIKVERRCDEGIVLQIWKLKKKEVSRQRAIENRKIRSAAACLTVREGTALETTDIGRRSALDGRAGSPTDLDEEHPAIKDR